VKQNLEVLSAVHHADGLRCLRKRANSVRPDDSLGSVLQSLLLKWLSSQVSALAALEHIDPLSNLEAYLFRVVLLQGIQQGSDL